MVFINLYEDSNIENVNYIVDCDSQSRYTEKPF